MNVIDVQELTKIYNSGMKKGGITALDGVTLSVPQGEIFGLLGPNGAGKTTFLKVLLGITQITAGTALIGGMAPSKPASRERVGYLPENYRFPDHLTGLGLLELTGRMCGVRQKDIDARADGLLELVGMDRWANTKIRKYSKGMQQRIGLAQALINDPEVLLLDEPTDGVDPVGKVEIKEALKRVRDDGKSIILNSHLLTEVETIADRVAILSRGKVVRVSTVDEITSRQSQYEIEADFGSKLIDIPKEMGKKISLSATSLIVELEDPEMVNNLIDLLRMKRISIRSVKPFRISLEQSFMETISSRDEGGL